MDLEAKIKENREKNASQNDVFFACVFQWILERSGEGFGRFWELLGVSWGTFKPLFLRRLEGHPTFVGCVRQLWAQEGPRGGQEKVLEGFWEGFGRPKWSKNRDFQYFLDMLFETLILVEFCSIFDNFNWGDGEKHFFSMGGCWCFWRG